MIHKVWLSFGSNVAEGPLLIESAAEKLKESVDRFKMSSVYRTPSIKNDGTLYHNSVAFFTSKLDFSTLNLRLKDLEKEAGRRSNIENPFAVELDLDIVIFDDTVIREKDYSREYFQIGYKEIKYHENGW